MQIAIARAFELLRHHGTQGSFFDRIVALREMLDDVELAIEQNLPSARLLVQGRRRLLESDRAAVFLC